MGGIQEPGARARFRDDDCANDQAPSANRLESGEGVADGFGVGNDGGGTVSGFTLRVGSGTGGALLLEFEFVFALAFSFAVGLTSAIGV